MTNQDTGEFYGWRNVAILFFLYSVMMGFVFYGFSVIFPAMLQAQGWGRGEAALAHTIRGLATGFLTPFAAFCIGKLGAKKTLNIGLAIGAAALALLGIVTKELWQWTIIWGVCMPLAFSLGGLLPIQTTVAYWFNKKRATALGIVMTGAPLGGVIAAPIYTYIIQQTGKWQNGWLVTAVICAIGFILALLIKNTPQSVGQYPDGIDPNAVQPETTEVNATPKAAGPYQTAEKWTLKEAVRTKVVWLQFLCMIGQGWSLYMITVHGVLHLQDIGFSAMEAASVFSVFIFFSASARVPIGILSDRIEPRIITSVAYLGLMLSLIALWKAPHNITIAMGIIAIFGFCFGTSVVTFPMLTANYFGPEAFAPINGLLAPIMLPFTAPLPVIAGVIFEKYNSYDLAFMPIIGYLFIATIIAWFLYPPQKKEAVIE